MPILAQAEQRKLFDVINSNDSLSYMYTSQLHVVTRSVRLRLRIIARLAVLGCRSPLVEEISRPDTTSCVLHSQEDLTL